MSRLSRTVMFLGAVALLHISNGEVHSPGSSPHCLPGAPCWPTNTEMWKFGQTLDGTFLFPTSPGYPKAITNHNTYTTRYPQGVVLVRTTEDVQKSVLFARKYNIRITIRSSGHDYNGRDTWDGSLMISLQNFTAMTFKNATMRAPDGEVTVASGQTWINVYQMLATVGRVIVGGSAHSVSMGGYTLGGGHAPISRMFGLAVDNLLETKMVTADGRIVTSTADLNRDLFWALRGGGGSTFGIVTEFTFKVHREPTSVVRCLVGYPVISKSGYNVAKGVLQMFSNLLLTLPREWGGYIGMNASPNKDGSIGTLSFFFNHFGSWDSNTRIIMDRLYNFDTSEQLFRDYRNYTSFLAYENSANAPESDKAYIFNILLANMTDAWIDETISLLFEAPMNHSVHFTGTLIGGAINEVSDDATAIHPGFRHSRISFTGSIVTNDISQGNILQLRGETMNQRMRVHGIGMYRNEASPLPNTWTDDFWGTNYLRLLNIKHTWDPEFIFTCFDCIGKRG